jgi:DNA-binding GntR family transcriptional regulator
MFEHNVKAETGEGPRHAEVAQDLMAGIASGRFPVGSLLPTEFELCEQYGASRYAVRIAINELVERGLVSRRKRAGTRVEARAVRGNYRQSLGSLDDLVQFSASHVREMQDTGVHVMDRTLADALGVAEGSRWLRISSLRLDGVPDALPIGWTDVYLDPAYSDVVEQARSLPDTLVVTLVEARHGRHAAEIRQDIAVSAVPARMSGALQAEAGSPALRIVRRYLDPDGTAFEISDSIHPAGRFTASSRLQRHRQ